MASFIKQENQTILWKTIQNTNIFNEVLSDNQKPLWFKQIIGMFYEQNCDRRLSRLDLENLNKQTIEYMISSLKNIKQINMTKKQQNLSNIKQKNISPQKRVSFQEEIGLSTNMPIDFRPEFSSNLEKKTIQSQQYVSEYSSRQQEYEQMMKREIPKEINFKEEISDDVIKNMDELLEEQRKQRELELFTVKPILSNTISIPPIDSSNTLNSNHRKTLIIQDENIETVPVINIDIDNKEFSIESNTIINDLSQIVQELKELKEELKNILFVKSNIIKQEIEENKIGELNETQKT